MMKKLLLLLFVVPSIIFAQSINSWDGVKNGFYSTSHVKTLNIFINIIYDVHPDSNVCKNDTLYWGNAYHEGINNEAIPTYSLIDNIYDTNNLSGTITRLYGESSWHAFQLTGNSIVVNVKESRVLDIGNFWSGNIVQAAANVINENGGVNDINNYTLDKPPADTNTICGNFYIRNISKEYGNMGYGNGYSFCLSQIGININNIPHFVCGTLQCVGGGEISKNPTSIYIHEISHSLFGSNNFHTSGGNHRSGTDSLMSFMTLQNGYGLMGAANSALVCCNGYERWRMHWKHPDAVDYISAMDSTHQTSIISDIQKGDGNKTFLLRDFITYGDAVRIKLPYKDREDCSNQYIWLENHQVGSNGKLDFLQYANTHSCRPDSVAGIYAYYQIGRDVLSGDLKIVRYANERDNLKFIPAEGYFNYQKQDVNAYNLECISWDNHYYTFVRQEANPFNGYQDMETQFHPQDNEDTISIYNEYPMWRKVIDNQAIDSMPFIGDSRDMFAAHTKLNMASNPSTCNAKTYYNCLKANNTLNYNHYYSRHNRTTYLTGLSIEMIPQTNKDFLVRIRWDDYDITNDAVFTGRIALKERAVLKAGNHITLTQNRTPAQPFRDNTTGYFDTLTIMCCENGSEFVQERNTSLNITENSQLIIQSGSIYNAYGNAQINVTKGGLLKLEQGASVKMHDTVLIQIDSSARMIIENNVKFGKNAKIIVKPGGKLVVNGATLTSDSVTVLWQGIEVWGTPDAAQYSGIRAVTSPQQGEVILNNAVIKNAVCGIRVGRQHLRNISKGGGVVKATNTQFVNNQRAVHFYAYSHVNAYNRVVDNISYFNECTFRVDNNAYFSVDTSNVQVALYNVRGVQFNGCVFEDLQTKNNWKKYGTALYACNAGFRINEQTDIFQYPATYYNTPCTFSNYKNAIAIVGSAEKPVKIYNTMFNDNSTGVNAKNADALSILSSYFSSGNESFSSYVHGLILDSCNFYRIENNQFTGIGNGIKIIGKTEDNNTIRLNTFNSLCKAIEVYGTNGNVIFDDPSIILTGLQFECNEFIMDSTDIYVAPQTFIKRTQGSTNHACGNYLGDQSIMQFTNLNTQLLLMYFYNYNVNAQKPIRYNNIDTIGVTHDICGERHGYIGDSYYDMPKILLDYENLYDANFQLYVSALDNYNSTYEGISIDWDNITAIDVTSNPQLFDLIQLSELKNILDETCIEAIHLLGNSTEVEITEITTWLQRLSSLNANLLGIHYFAQGNDVSQLQLAWDQITQHYSIVNPEDTSYYQYCINQINTWARDTVTDVNISQGAIDTLTAIANSNNTASFYAVSVLECINEFEPWWKLRIHTSCNWVVPVESMSPKKETEQGQTDAIQLHPNPTNGMIEIQSNNLNIKQIELFDIFGKLLIEKKANESTVTLDVSPYAKGMYLLRYTLSDDTQQTKKIIKE